MPEEESDLTMRSLEVRMKNFDRLFKSVRACYVGRIREALSEDLQVLRHWGLDGLLDGCGEANTQYDKDVVVVESLPGAGRPGEASQCNCHHPFGDT